MINILFENLFIETIIPIKHKNNSISIILISGNHFQNQQITHSI